MEKEKLKEILHLHKLWLEGSNEGGRANLQNANIRYADLQNANLQNANLQYADLWNANLQYADLRGITTESIRNLNVISAQLNTSEKNRKVTYWVDLDVVTAGCWQSNWEEFKKRVADVYGENEKMKRKYDRVIKFIEDEVAEEKDK